jgi:hypothetical protein
MSTCWPFRALEQLFRHKVLKLLLLEGRIISFSLDLPNLLQKGVSEWNKKAFTANSPPFLTST